MIQAFCESLGASRDRTPASPHGSPADHVAWGVDSVTAACRMLLMGQAIGAAALLRSQLERWTFNLAFAQGIEFSADGFGTDEMRDLWSVHELRVDVTKQWIDLSEMLHGRGELADIARWEAVHALKGPAPAAVEKLASAILPVLRQLASWRHVNATPCC